MHVLRASSLATAVTRRVGRANGTGLGLDPTARRALSTAAPRGYHASPRRLSTSTAAAAAESTSGGFLRHLSARHDAGAAAITAVVGGVGLLGIRQVTYGQHPVAKVAKAQLQSSEAVKELLGGDVSARGVVGGCVDLPSGTAVLTLPLRCAATGRTAECRVEAEAEWAASGAPEPELAEKSASRWQLRHLEVTPQGADGVACAAETLVLYSLPANLPPSKWAPRERPANMPRWLHALLPNVRAMLDDREMWRLGAVSLFAIACNAIGFAVLRKRADTQKRATTAFQILYIREPDATLAALAARAMRIAHAHETAAAGVKGGSAVAAAPPKIASLHGWRGTDEMAIIAPAASKHKEDDLVFGARRSASGWSLTHVSLQTQLEFELKLGELAEDRWRDGDELRQLLLYMISDFTSYDLPVADGGSQKGEAGGAEAAVATTTTGAPRPAGAAGRPGIRPGMRRGA